VGGTGLGEGVRSKGLKSPSGVQGQSPGKGYGMKTPEADAKC